MDSQIDNAIERWFKETETAFGAILTISPVDFLCCSVTAVAHNYCSATLSILNNGHRLPAMALLRVLAELAFRLVWCLYSDNPQRESCEVRIKRWLKTGLLERKKYVRRMIERKACSVDEMDGFKKELEALEKMILQNTEQPVGHFLGSLSDLPEPYNKDLYPLLYNIFNCGIHIDPLMLTRLVKQDANFHIVASDLDENPAVLKIYCLTIAFNILAVVRKNYNWDYDAIKIEYLKIKKDFSEGKL